MKKIVVSFIVLVVSLPAFSQMVNYTIESQKAYENGSKTVYLRFEGDFSAQARAVIEREFKTRIAVRQFSFYDQNNPTKMMFTATSGFSERELDEIMAEVHASSSETSDAKNTNIRKDRDDLDYIKFDIEGVSSKAEMKRVEAKLKSTDFIEYVAFGNLTECKLAVKKGTDMQDIKQAFETAGVRASRK